MKEWALRYSQSLNLSVFPVHTIVASRCSCGNPKCQSAGKHPRTKNGVIDATTDFRQINEWWTQWPDANIGIATGVQSGIVVIDIDPRHDGDASFQLMEAEAGKTPDTWEVLTGGGGRHIYLKHPGYKMGNRANILPGVDLRGDGGYVLAPPSNHLSGRTYEWEGSSDPFDDIKLAGIPTDWQAVLSNQNYKQTFSLPEEITEGARNETLFKLASSLRSRGLSERAILAALNEENDQRVKPPLNRADIERIASSASRYEQGTITIVGTLNTLNTSDNPMMLIRAAMQQMQPGDSITQEIIGNLALLSDSSPADYSVMKGELFRTLKFGKKELDQEVARFKKRAVQEKRDVEPWILAKDRIDDFPYEETRIPFNGFDWIWNAEGMQAVVKDETGIPQSIVFSGTPAAITRRFRNIDTDERKIELTYKFKGRWRSLTAMQSTVFNARSIVELTDNDMGLSSESSRLMVRFLEQQYRINSDIMPEIGTVGRFGWIGNDYDVFMPHNAHEVKFDDANSEGYLSAFTQKGTLEEWRDSIGAISRSYPLARLQMAGACAAPLLRILNQRTFFLHVFGRSGGGKSAGVYAAASFWGNPDGLKTTFGGTRVGLENMAATFTDLPLVIDEKQVAGDRRDHIRSLIYMITLEQSKARGTKTGGLQRQRHWRTLALTTGEHPLTDDSMEAGTKNRMLEISGRPFENGEADIKRIYDRTSVYHGSAGREFISQLIKADKDQLKARFDELVEYFRTVEPEVQLAHCGMMAVLALADELSSRWIYNMDIEEARQQAETMALVFLGELETKEQTDDASRAREYFRSYIGSHEAYFDIAREVRGETYGFYEGEELYVFPDQFNKIMNEGGFNPKRVLRDWADEGWIRIEKSGSDRFFSVRKQRGAKRERFICFLWKI